MITPKRGQPTYLSRMLIETTIRRELTRIHSKDNSLVLLDLGGGNARYEALVPPAWKYIPLDPFVRSRNGIISVGEDLSLGDNTCDVVMCIQVLEHVEEPSKVISEIARVLKPNGVLILTTHGTMFYHPTPNDYWRWTQAGLMKVFENSDGFSSISVTPLGTTITTIGYFSATYCWLFGMLIRGKTPSALRSIVYYLTSFAVAIINTVFVYIHTRIRWLNEPSAANTLFLMFLVKATRK